MAETSGPEIEIEPVYDGHRLILHDMFIDGQWHGSRRTYPQCLEYLNGELHDLQDDRG